MPDCFAGYTAWKWKRRGFYLDKDIHVADNPDCDACWPGFPVRCECGGLIHASFGDEDWDGYWLYYLCDKCEDTWGP